MQGRRWKKQQENLIISHCKGPHNMPSCSRTTYFKNLLKSWIDIMIWRSSKVFLDISDIGQPESAPPEGLAWDPCPKRPSGLNEWIWMEWSISYRIVLTELHRDIFGTSTYCIPITSNHIQQHSHEHKNPRPHTVPHKLYTFLGHVMSCKIL